MCGVEIVREGETASPSRSEFPHKHKTKTILPTQERLT